MTKIEERQKLIQAATPGPVYYGIAYNRERGPIPFDYKAPGYYDNPGINSATADVTIVGCDEYNIFNSPADAALIVAAVNDYAALLDFVTDSTAFAEGRMDRADWLAALAKFEGEP